jgi:WD40 repeat protein
MEELASTNNFLIINFNLKKIIFSFLNRQDQRTIYWMNKKLRNILPDSALTINMNSLRKYSSYQLDSKPRGVLELSDGTISCYTEEGIKLLKINNNNKLELIKTLPIECYYNTHPVLFENEDIIFISGWSELRICNKDFNLIETYKESNGIMSLCNISELSFAVGMYGGIIKVYTRNGNTQKYEVKEYECHSRYVLSLLYLPKQNYLLSGSFNSTINVLSLSEGKSIEKLYGPNNTVTSLLSLNDETFACGSYEGVIKIWSIKADTSIECIRTLEAPEGRLYGIYLNLLGNDLMLSRSRCECKIWDVKTYKCIKTFYEDSFINKMIVTKNQNIITETQDNKVNMWKILV